MYSFLIGAVLSALAITPIAAAPSPELFGRAKNLQCHLRGGSTGVKKVDGQLLGARPKANTYLGFSLPYGQVPQVFTVDDKTSYVYGAETGTGQKLLWSAVPIATGAGNGTAAVKLAVAGSKGSLPIECTSVGISPRQLLCNVNVNGRLYSKLLVIDLKGDGNYELVIGPSGGVAPQVALNVEPVS